MDSGNQPNNALAIRFALQFLRVDVLADLSQKLSGIIGVVLDRSLNGREVFVVTLGSDVVAEPIQHF